MVHVFVTGATGFIGSAVVRELLRAGYEVSGLARSDKGATALQALGVRVVRGDLQDTEGLRKAASSSDGVLHLGFLHDFSDYAKCIALDQAAIEALGEGLRGTNKPLIVTSGTMVVGGPIANGLRVASNERTQADRSDPFAARVSSEVTTWAQASKGVVAQVVRLPPTVHGDGDHGLIPALINIARTRRESSYVDDGIQRWPAVHRDDAARVYRLALEKGKQGDVWNAVAEDGISTRIIADVIGRKLGGLPVTSARAAQAAQAFGFLAHFWGRDNPVSARLTRDTLGWYPTHKTLMEDLETGDYFDAPKPQ
jgi:nucleoside-diphosphate-sugar epimerase